MNLQERMKHPREVGISKIPLTLSTSIASFWEVGISKYLWSCQPLNLDCDLLWSTSWLKSLEYLWFCHWQVVNLYCISFTTKPLWWNLQERLESLKYLWSCQPLNLHCDLLSSTSWNGGGEGKRERRPLGEKSCIFYAFCTPGWKFLSFDQINKLRDCCKRRAPNHCIAKILFAFLQSKMVFIIKHFWEWG